DLDDHFLTPDFSSYRESAFSSPYPHNGVIAALAHAQHGLVGYAHPFDGPVNPGKDLELTNALPADVALGNADYYELVGFSDHRSSADIWYRLLNAGFRLPAGAGTDAMANFASLHGPVGMNRVFVRSGTPLDYRRWLAALKAGRTFVSNGPLLSFSLDGHEAGAELRFPAGAPAHQVVARVSLRSNVPVERLEIVTNGVVLAPIP